ncbi:unnamed protein product [Clonostachys rosea]|uniref:Aminoglycoside phosphotransferase domain-containing protein n=1 Tax=Bionectria ochroleuca TaxID=29856 RepID=A0ABY6TY99_BIOOC|nr:unnamed protein product [Clonostachys rosea]
MGSNSNEEEAFALLCRLLPGLPINRVRVASNGGIQQTYVVDIAGWNGPFLFHTTHHSWVNPLRSEYCSISSEAALLAWYSGISSRVCGGEVGNTNDEKDGHRVRESPDNDVYCTKLYLSGFLPTFIKYGPPNPEAQVPEYSLSRPRPGKVVSSLPQPPNNDDYTSINQQAGQLFRRIACHVSPTGTFGDITSVMRPLGVIPMRPTVRTPANAPYIYGSTTWSGAFHLMLESVLRDLEDHFVNIPYSRIRGHFERLRPVLDKVTRPSLVAITCSSMQNILVVESHADDPESSTVSKEAKVPKSSPTDQEPGPHTRPATPETRDKYKVTGLSDWSMLVFGDPLIATVFHEEATESFMSGLHEPIAEDDPFTSVSIIEHADSAPLRLLLYNCYHALNDLAKQYYHDPQGDAEMEARRRLLLALRELDRVPDGTEFEENLQEDISIGEASIATDAVGANKKFGVTS